MAPTRGFTTYLSLLCIVTCLVACHPEGALERTCGGGRFLVRAKTVRDTSTGLTWQRQPVAEKMDWDHANRYCQSIGMTLPSSLVLSQIMKTGERGKRALDECAFPGQSPEPDTVQDGSDTYWSATSQGLFLNKAPSEDNRPKVCVSGLGDLGRDPKTTSHRVRCVRP